MVIKKLREQCAVRVCTGNLPVLDPVPQRCARFFKFLRAAVQYTRWQWSNHGQIMVDRLSRVADNSSELLWRRPVEEMAISKFKATCLAVLERVRKTGEPILITRFGHPVAEIVAPGASKPARVLATMLGSGRIIGDIVGPISDESDWEAAQE